MIKVLFDIDVILDVLEPRKDFYLDSFSALTLCDLEKIEGWVSADSHSTIHYFLRKELDEFTSRERIVDNLRSLSTIPVRNATLVNAFESKNPDFEDNLKIASAQEFYLNFIVTRNTKHYKQSPVEALTPREFMIRYKSGNLLNEKTSVPFMDLKAQHHAIYNEVDDRITDIIGNTGFILGKHVQEFEERFAAAQGAKYCIGVSSGTDALHVAMMALGIGPGDRVIVPVNTFMATAEAVSLCGAEPVFVDCDRYWNLDAQKLQSLLSSMSHEPSAKSSLPKAVIPVHLYGQPANLDEITALAESYGLQVVEDCAQAHLAKYRRSDDRCQRTDDGWEKVGNRGAFGCFSFYPGKNLGAWGEAGALITNNQELYTQAKMIRAHGEIERYHHQVIGHNYRMEAFQGAVLGVKLDHLETWTKQRQAKARLYIQLLADIPEVETPQERSGTWPVYHLYVIQAQHRDKLREHLQARGIGTGLHYPVPLHLQPAYAGLGYGRGAFPVAEAAAETMLSLPMYPELRQEQVEYVAAGIGEFYQRG